MRIPLFTLFRGRISISSSTVGAPLAGRLSDRIVVKYRAKRGGHWVPEDRLRASMLGAIALVPVSVFMSGFVTQFVEGSKWALTWNLCCLFVNGLGVSEAALVVVRYQWVVFDET